MVLGGHRERGCERAACGRERTDELGWSCLAGIIENPVQLATLCLTVLSVFIDPTTAGLGDSARALTYKKPADF